MIDTDAIRILADIPAVQARRLGDAPALACDGRATSFAELADRAARFRNGLHAHGIRPGDRIALLNWNDDSWFEIFFGAAAARVCLVPINARLSAAEIAHIVEDCGTRLLFVGRALLAVAEAALATFAAPPTLVVLDDPDSGLAAWTAWTAGAPSAAEDPPQASDDVLQLYTSGTTGRPKGVVLTNANYTGFLHAVNGIEGFSYDSGETVLAVMPLFHVAGTNVAFAALAQGCRLYLLREIVPELTIAIMEREAVAHAFLAPVIIQMLIRSLAIEGARFPALRTISYGASPIAEDVLRRAQAAFGCGFVQFYGSTETTASGTTLSPADHGDAALLRSCGRPWPGTEVAVLGPGGARLAPGAIGEIAIRGPLIMRGYWQRPEATAEAITADGWLRTGDAGYVDADGYFFVHDRIKDMIVSGGENVYPAEVENAIQGCPGVAEVAVIGVPDDRWGEAALALIVPAPGTSPSPADVIAWARERIAHYKAPKRVMIVEALPRNASGKVLRRELRASFWEGRERAVG